jgi:hypothetical protein
MYMLSTPLSAQYKTKLLVVVCATRSFLSLN